MKHKKDCILEWCICDLYEIEKNTKQQEIVSTLKSIPSYDKVVEIIKTNTDYRNTELDFFTVTHKHGIFEIFTREFINTLSFFIRNRFGRSIKIIEVCAGDGRLSVALKEKGFNITPVDEMSRKDINYPDFVIKDSALNYVKENKPDLIIASWIEYGDNLDIELVKTGIPLIIIGESQSGCTGTEEFWDRKDFVYEYLEEVSVYNISRTDMAISMHHTSTQLVKLKSKMTEAENERF